MPPIREHITLYTFLGDEDDEEDDVDGEEDPDMDMPPLVDAPALSHTDTAHAPPPPAPTQESMMSSFEFRFSPGAALGSPFAATLVYPPDSFNTEGGVDGADGGNTTMGGRRRGRPAGNAPYPSPTTASSSGGGYIPRPPNAFILFRSHFIKSQKLPGRVEGNHSNLSKIIGKLWKLLSPDERARWEDKARAAQAEHRRRYPDWRFRPGNGKNDGKPKGRRKGRIKDDGEGGEPGDLIDHHSAFASPNAIASSSKAKLSPAKSHSAPAGTGTKKDGGALEGKGKARERDDDDGTGAVEGDVEGGAEADVNLNMNLLDKDADGGARMYRDARRSGRGKDKGKGRDRRRSPDKGQQRADGDRGGGIDADAREGAGDREREEKEREKEERAEAEEARREKITDLLVEGKTGRELAAAMEAWEVSGRGRGIGRERQYGTDSSAKAASGTTTTKTARGQPRVRGRDASESPRLRPPPATTSTAQATTSNTLMLPPLTHMYKRSLSAPVGDRVAYPSVSPPSPFTPLTPPSPFPPMSPSSPFLSVSPSPFLSPPVIYASPFQSPVLPMARASPVRASPVLPMARVQEGVEQPAYPPQAPYEYAQPQPQLNQQQPQRHTPYHAPTHARRDTISFPVSAPAGWHASSSSHVRTHSHSQPHTHAHVPRRERGGAYTYPPLHAHTDPGIGPGPAPRYAGAGTARHWWERARGVDGFGVGGNNHRDATASYAGAGVGGEASVYAAVGVDAHIGRSTEDVGGVDDADEGWADGGVGFAEYPPSPSPPASRASPYAAHAKAAPIIPESGEGIGGADPYTQPLPLSPMSDDGDPRFRFPLRDESFRFPRTADERGFRFNETAAADSGGGEDRRFAQAPAAISSFSTLSGWAGEYTAFPASPVTASFETAGGVGAGGENASGGGTVFGTTAVSVSAPGTPPSRTSGWFQPPGWENSILGAGEAWGGGADVEMGDAAGTWSQL